MRRSPCLTTSSEDAGCFYLQKSRRNPCSGLKKRHIPTACASLSCASRKRTRRDTTMAPRTHRLPNSERGKREAGTRLQVWCQSSGAPARKETRQGVAGKPGNACDARHGGLALRGSGSVMPRVSPALPKGQLRSRNSRAALPTLKGQARLGKRAFKSGMRSEFQHANQMENTQSSSVGRTRRGKLGGVLVCPWALKGRKRPSPAKQDH